MEIGLIATWAGLAASIGLYIWRLSALNSQVKENTKDINGVGNKLHDINNSVNKEIELLNDKFLCNLKESNAILSQLSNNMVRLETKVDIMMSEKEIK